MSLTYLAKRPVVRKSRRFKRTKLVIVKFCPRILWNQSDRIIKVYQGATKICAVDTLHISKQAVKIARIKNNLTKYVISFEKRKYCA
jgi:hypothetical protein